MKAVPRLSKSAIIFAPNGSGKTNFVVALQTLRDLVLHSTAYSEAQFAELHTPFQFGPAAFSPTEFKIDLLVEKVRYRYGVSYNAQRICSERLLVYKTGKAQRWFERRYDEASRSEAWSAFSPNFNGPREMWRRATRSRRCFSPPRPSSVRIKVDDVRIAEPDASPLEAGAVRAAALAHAPHSRHGAQLEFLYSARGGPRAVPLGHRTRNIAGGG